MTPQQRAQTKHLVTTTTLSFTEIARRHKATPYSVILAWILSKGSRVLAIPGTTQAKHARENARAIALRLEVSELLAIDGFTVSAAGK